MPSKTPNVNAVLIYTHLKQQTSKVETYIQDNLLSTINLAVQGDEWIQTYYPLVSR